MTRTDLIADSFTIIRNALMVNKEEALIPYSNLMNELCQILKQEGYIENTKEVDLGSFKKIKVYLKYENKRSVIKRIEKVSTPGRRVYFSCEDVPSVLNGKGVGLFSTSKGVLTDSQARDKGVGGEYIGRVW